MTSDLIIRLSKLDAPDREVDAEIAIHLLGYTRVNRMEKWPEAQPIWDFYEGEPLNSNGVLISRYTGSLDAATALADRVLPGWDHGYERYDDKLAMGKVWKRGWHDETVILAHAATPALAIVIAILRAKDAWQP